MKYVIVSILLLSAKLLCAQSMYGMITGNVHDANRSENIDSASISIMLNGITVTEILSDSNGNFTTKLNLVPGYYTLNFFYKGYRLTTIEEVNVISDRSTPVSVGLWRAIGSNNNPVIYKWENPYIDHEAEVDKRDMLLRDSVRSAEIEHLPFPDMEIIFSDTTQQALPRFRDTAGKAYYIDGFRKIERKKK